MTLTYATVFAIVAGLAAAGFGAYLTHLEAAAIDDSLVAQAQALSAAVDTAAGRVTFSGGDTLPGQTAQGVAVDALLVDARGTVLDRSGQAPALNEVLGVVRQALGSTQPVFESISVRGVNERVRAERVSAGAAQNLVLVVSRSTAEADSTAQRTELLIVAIAAALTAVASVLGYVVAGRALRPVRVIAATARDISEHDLHRRIDLALPNDELGELAATFNGMLARLEASFTALQRFTADAAHELRAPLAVMLAQVEVELRRERSVAEYRDALHTIRGEIERLSRVADHLLVLARADAGALRPRPQSIDLPDFLEELLARWRPLATQRQVAVVSDLPDTGVLEADPDLLSRLFDNLLDNAVKHTDAGGRVVVSAQRDAAVWRIEVADTGAGIAEPLRAHLFEPFTRGDVARGRDSGGAGLGLALCAAIAEAHGGSIALGGGPGARLVVLLPASAPHR